MVLVAPGICRYTINQRYGGEVIANVLDMQIDTTGSVNDREDALFGVAGDILNNWVDHVMDAQSDDLLFESISYVDLDSANGATGERTQTSARTLPVGGAFTEATMPGNVALLVRKQISGSRGARSGRMYIAGIRESDTDNPNPNTVAGSRLTQYQGFLDLFLSGINDGTTGIYSVQRQLVVVHTTNTGTAQNPNIVYSGFSPVSSLVPQSRLATQRRRLR